MPLDKSWMQGMRSSMEYYQGVKEFLNYAYSHEMRVDHGRIVCPCVKCSFRYNLVRDEVNLHLLQYGMRKDYKVWYLHGENEDDGTDTDSYDEGDYDCDATTPMELADDMQGLVEESFPENPNRDAEKFYKLLEEAAKPLYKGSQKYSTLSFIVKLLHIKSVGGMSNKGFDMLLETLKDTYPQSENLPTSNYGAKKMIKELGLGCEKIHACDNDCILYYKEYADATECPTCKLSRWRPESVGEGKKKPKQIPWKVLRYFPLTPRLQRLFMCSKTATSMRWHSEDRVKDGNLRHPADSLSWKHFDTIHELFSDEIRNVRLGLATDGFNPFGNMSVNHSTWPVILFPYNLPPWMCMKEPYTFLSLLIPGPKSPCMDIDVYLMPLIDELNVLWNTGVETYDISKKQNFQMRAALMWTISDYPGYAYLSGWSTQGRLACAYCGSETPYRYLDNCRKECYMRNRRFLPKNDPMRNKRAEFDDTIEKEVAPEIPSGEDVENELNNLNIVPGKKFIPGFGSTHNWKKHSIFFQLPYWKTLLLRHNLDVMHIEKNFFDSLFGTIMNLSDKTKDSLKARFDCQEMKVKPHLHPREEDGEIVYDAGPYELSEEDIRALCQWLKKLKVPDGYCSNISRCVNAFGRFSYYGLKTHDCHIFLERLLPLVARELLPKDPREAVIEICYFFKELCAKVLKVEDLEILEQNVYRTLCKLEKVFPPSFFTIMIHLPTHLAWEARIAGPVQYRWMYPVERYLHKLKTYVRNKARPEGSIAEGYLADECITFCSRYLNQIETKFNREERNYDGSEEIGEEAMDPSRLSIFSMPGKALGAGEFKNLCEKEHKIAHHYVLTNCEEVQSYIEDHKKFLRDRHGTDNVDRLHMDEFAYWFNQRIQELYDDGKVSKDMLSLAQGPERRAKYYPVYNIHGFRFHTLHRDDGKKTQNSGVMVKGENQADDSVPWYGTIRDIVELRYTDWNRVVMFKCKWYATDTRSDYKVDQYGVLTVGTKAKFTEEPFVLAFQATQVYYVEGIKNRTWSVVVETKPRNVFEMPENETGDENEELFQGEPYQEEESRATHSY